MRGLPFGLNHAAAAAYGGRLYVLGGYRSSSGIGRDSAALLRYNPHTDRWTRLRDMPTARGALAGRTSAGNLAVVERYDPASGRWQRLPDMHKPRGGIAAAAPAGRIVVVGGEEAAGTIAEVETYDAARRRWSALPDMPAPRHGLGAVAYRGAIYVLEGGPSPGFAFSAAAERLVLSAASRASTSFGLSR